MQIPADWQTPKFWLTALTSLITAAVFLGVVPASDAQNLNVLVTAVVSGVVATVTLVTYIWAAVQRLKIQQSGGPTVTDLPAGSTLTYPDGTTVTVGGTPAAPPALMNLAPLSAAAVAARHGLPPQPSPPNVAGTGWTPLSRTHEEIRADMGQPPAPPSDA